MNKIVTRLKGVPSALLVVGAGFIMAAGADLRAAVPSDDIDLVTLADLSAELELSITEAEAGERAGEQDDGRDEQSRTHSIG